MQSFCLAVVFVLIPVITNVFSICPESGCECNEHCVNGGNIWCSNKNDEDCSCKRGCLILDTLVEAGKRKSVHCNQCRCSHTGYSDSCTRMIGCIPEGFTLGVHYPDRTVENPNCDERL